jgi:hypothetical protein
MDELLLLLLLMGVGLWGLKRQGEKRRIACLARHLAALDVERAMEQVMEGYLRAMGASDTVRRNEVLAVLQPVESRLVTDLTELAARLMAAPTADMRISTLPLPLPELARWWPRASFEFSQVMRLHARSVEDAIHNVQQLDGPARAFRVTAELLLMQHTCHWFCKSRAVASLRLLARHKTSHQQVLAAVAPGTRLAYLALTGQSPAASA